MALEKACWYSTDFPSRSLDDTQGENPLDSEANYLGISLVLLKLVSCFSNVFRSAVSSIRPRKSSNSKLPSLHRLPRAFTSRVAASILCYSYSEFLRRSLLIHRRGSSISFQRIHPFHCLNFQPPCCLSKTFSNNAATSLALPSVSARTSLSPNVSSSPNSHISCSWRIRVWTSSAARI